MSVLVRTYAHTKIPRIPVRPPSHPSCWPLPVCQLWLEEAVFMEVWLNPVLAASRHDLLILLPHSHSPLTISQTAPPLLAHSVYYSTFHSGSIPLHLPTSPQPSMISPSRSRCPPHPVSLCCECTFVPTREFLRRKRVWQGRGGQTNKTNYN